MLSQEGHKVNLRLPLVGKSVKKNISHWFNRDLVARGSPGLKPLRHRAPRVQPTRGANTRPTHELSLTRGGVREVSSASEVRC